MTTKEENLIKLNELKQKGNIFITDYVSPYFNYCRDISYEIIKNKFIEYEEEYRVFNDWNRVKYNIKIELKYFEFIKEKHIEDFIELYKTYITPDFYLWGSYWNLNDIKISNIKKLKELNLSDYLYFIKTDCDINILHRKIKIKKLSKL